MAVGNLNGSWEKLFKIVLVIVPLFLSGIGAYNAWLIGRVGDIKDEVLAFRGEFNLLTYKLDEIIAKDYYTKEAAEAAQLMMQMEIMDQMSESFPPKWLISDIEDLESKTSLQSELIEANKAEINRQRNRLDNLNN